ncbi:MULTISPECIES: nucleoside phosphorylase [Halobacterium]|uniref:nucleoside phosphorylase n=1 Tax=Halobacterium TaxID=2239 RepID=UPI00073F6529|nr:MULTISPECIES: nucleoside phosphorylase [Halobacterium]MCG1003993.1 nucleoside phosphorylase [Halobacterium noricense]
MAKQPHLLVEEGDVYDIALLPGDPGRVDRIASHCDDSEVVAENREYKVVNATYDGVDLTISSTGIGCPSAAIAVEELSRVGVETFLRVGTIGALQADIDVGDMIVATGAAKEEGTSKRYESEVYPAVPDFDVLTSLVDSAEAREGVGSHEDSPTRDGPSGATVHVGPIVSDDAFYNEDEDFVDDWNDAGLLAVEMEAATVFSLARRKGLAAGAICTADGNLVAGNQKGADSDDELPEKAKNNVARAIDISLDAVTRLA